MTTFLLVFAATALLGLPRLPSWWRRFGDLVHAPDTSNPPRRHPLPGRKTRSALAAATRMLN